MSGYLLTVVGIPVGGVAGTLLLLSLSVYRHAWPFLRASCYEWHWLRAGRRAARSMRPGTEVLISGTVVDTKPGLPLRWRDWWSPTETHAEVVRLDRALEAHRRSAEIVALILENGDGDRILVEPKRRVVGHVASSEVAMGQRVEIIGRLADVREEQISSAMELEPAGYRDAPKSRLIAVPAAAAATTAHGKRVLVLEDPVTRTMLLSSSSLERVAAYAFAVEVLRMVGGTVAPFVLFVAMFWGCWEGTMAVWKLVLAGAVSVLALLAARRARGGALWAAWNAEAGRTPPDL